MVKTDFFSEFGSKMLNILTIDWFSFIKPNNEATSTTSVKVREKSPNRKSEHQQIVTSNSSNDTVTVPMKTNEATSKTQETTVGDVSSEGISTVSFQEEPVFFIGV